MTPKSVLDAGRAEREKWVIRLETMEKSSVLEVLESGARQIKLSRIPHVECQYFIDDRVFRAMLRALVAEADANDNVVAGEYIHESTRGNLLSLAEDADG